MKYDLQYFFVPKYAKWIIVSLVSLFSILILVEFASLVFSRVKISEPSQNEIKSETDKNTDADNNLKVYPLFGVYVPNDLNVDSVKKSMLDVTLVGIVFAKNIEDSMVIIRSTSGEEKTYMVGDTIPGEAKIKRITAEGVLVERDGILESISLPKDELTFEPLPKPMKEE